MHAKIFDPSPGLDPFSENQYANLLHQLLDVSWIGCFQLVLVVREVPCALNISSLFTLGRMAVRQRRV
jgi:hypothetical protein